PDVYGELGHAGAGLTVGRNGIVVYEHSDGYYAPTLVFEAPITNWTYVAVAYEENKPRLFLNGKMVHEGIRGPFIVHCGVGVPHRRGIGPFRGAMGPFKKFDHVLTEAEVADEMKATPIPEIPADNPVVTLARVPNGSLRAQIW